MAPKVDKVVSDRVLPEAVDVAIVGGGIIGVAAALTLAERGISVALFEKGIVAGEQSGRNWGWCREQLRSLPEVPLAMRSMALWRGMAERIGEDAGFRQTGMMVVSKDREEVARWQQWLDDTAHYGMEGGLLSAQETRAMLPETSEDWIGAIHSPVDGWAEPATAAPAMARAAQRKGALIFQNCALRGWERSGGAISHVVTEKGRVRCSRVLVAGGAWSSLLLRNQGLKFAQSGVYATAFRTEAGPEVFAGGVGSPFFSYRRRADGGYTIGLRGRGRVELTPAGLMSARAMLPLFLSRRGDLTLRIGRSFFDGPFALHRWKLSRPSPFERHRRYDPAPDAAIVRDGIAAFRAAYPVLGELGVAESWGGLIDATPDMVPAIAPVAGEPGCVLASGFSGHGFALGPAAGELAADLLTGTAPQVDPAPFALSRFAEGRAHAIHRWV
ncbi:NAD(P)/FAD-dependent oxidoreductase [Salipiger abyssi]|uniref:Glycine/D-amino acid oxidase, deaminating n=1 Tax=Salipiger abyssi TaxID=1250539 RepID=A0A1P8US24_9RHOB|nr:FAD-binding oxidoreductase [Salipiger abyssi]APZ52201.1 glycine/D-amino acid oxidase, deaminating [Salipiger abyssi]